MQIYPTDSSVPDGLRIEELWLRPLAPTDNARDYEAVMATQALLRLRGNGEWPHADFTPEENLADLEGHEADFQDRLGFTYTVLDPSGTRCLGCVYVYPLDEALRRVDADNEPVAGVGDHEAVVWFWVRPDGVPEDLDRKLFTELLPWLRDDFAFARVVFTSWTADERQTSLMREAGLRPVLSHPGSDTHALYFE